MGTNMRQHAGVDKQWTFRVGQITVMEKVKLWWQAADISPSPTVTRNDMAKTENCKYALNKCSPRVVHPVPACVYGR